MIIEYDTQIVSHHSSSVNELMPIDSKIFKAYDIRGLAEEVTPELAERVGRAIVAFTGADCVVVGRDMRSSSPALLKAVIDGVTKAGADAVNIGLASTPLFYYAVGTQFADAPERGAGIMVTASHNPKEYNGMKLERGDVTSICAGGGMEEIRDMVLGGKFADAAEGNVIEIDAREEYIDTLLSIIPKREIGGSRVVCDAGNGMAGHVAPLVMKAYGLDKRGRKLFFELDGSFPNHPPNPIHPENLAALKAAVLKEGAELGVAFDGDADRVGFLDEKGNAVSGDIITALLAGEMLRKDPGGTIVYDAASGRAVPDAVKAAGGVAMMSKVGHSFMKLKMRETGACFAGERSTHYYFRDLFCAESSDLAMLSLLGLMKRTGRRLSELAAPLLSKYHHSGEINFRADDKEAVMKRLEEKYAPLCRELIRLDGLRFEFDSWWFGVRASNTEPLIRLNLEASSDQEMKEKTGEVSKIIAP
jgi:phosphomannomutase